MRNGKQEREKLNKFQRAKMALSRLKTISKDLALVRIRSLATILDN